jgi:hypothetical protein
MSVMLMMVMLVPLPAILEVCCADLRAPCGMLCLHSRPRDARRGWGQRSEGYAGAKLWYGVEKLVAPIVVRLTKCLKVWGLGLIRFFNAAGYVPKGLFAGVE